MKKINAFAIIILFLAHSAGLAIVHIDVETSGKRIQRDGFLLEWRLDKAIMLDSARDMRIDVMNTPEGLAGYVRFMSKDTCGKWTFSLFPRVGVWKNSIIITADSVPGPDAIYAADSIITDSARYTALEWIISWDNCALDSATDSYEVGLSAYSLCGDSLPGVIISGTKPPSASRGIWGRKLIAQMVLICLMLVAYFVLQVRIRKYRRKRTPPANRS